MRRWRRSLLGVLGALLAGGSARGAALSLGDLDPCAPVWARPDRAFRERDPCTPRYPPSEIAREGGFVLFGSLWDTSAPGSRLRPFERCVPYTHEGNAEFVEAVRSARRAGDPPVAFVQLHRFELVARTQAALPEFRSSFLARPLRPLSDALAFFANDTGACAPQGCRLIGSFDGNPAEDKGARLFDLIDAAGAPGDHEQAVYYIAQPSPGARVFWTLAAMGDLGNPAYRRFRVAEAKRAMALGHYDAIMLNQKFNQFRDARGYWIRSERVPDVAAVLRQDHETFWTSQPASQGYAEYVAGWAALGRDLKAAGVPYAVWVGKDEWRQGNDKPGSHVDERALVRATAAGARIVVLQQPMTAGDFSRIAGTLKAAGVEAVVRGPGARNTCGDGRALTPHFGAATRGGS